MDIVSLGLLTLGRRVGGVRGIGGVGGIGGVRRVGGVGGVGGVRRIRRTRVPGVNETNDVRGKFFMLSQSCITYQRHFHQLEWRTSPHM